jgi:hypothetical protein
VVADDQPTVRSISSICRFNGSTTRIPFQSEPVDFNGQIGIGEDFIYLVIRLSHTEDTTSFAVVSREDGIVHAGHVIDRELYLTSRHDSLEEWCEDNSVFGTLVGILATPAEDSEGLFERAKHSAEQLVEVVNADETTLLESFDVEIQEDYGEPDEEFLLFSIPEIHQLAKDAPPPPEVIDSL